MTTTSTIPYAQARPWRCHHCGAAGTDVAGGEWHLNDVARTYLRPFCQACTPLPDVPLMASENTTIANSAEFEVHPDWTAHQDLVVARWDALSEAVTALKAIRSDIYTCSLCEGAWGVDPYVWLPLGAFRGSREEGLWHPCPECWLATPVGELVTKHCEAWGRYGIR